MSTQLPDLTAKIRLDTSGLDRGLSRAHGSLRKFGGLAAAAVGGLGFAAAVKEIGTLGIAYQDSLNIFRSVSGANAAQMKKVGDAAKTLGNDLTLPNTSAAGAATAMTELAKAGLSVNDALKAAKGTLQLATAGAISEGEAATVAANALNTFGLNGDQATRVANVLANAANASSGEITDFAQGLAQGGLVAKQAGLSIEETAGALALFANNGLQGSDAGTSLKTALLRLSAPTKDVQKLMAKLGINVRDSKGNMKPLAQIAQVLKDRLHGLSDAQRSQAMSAIFGSDAIRAGTLLYNAGATGVDKYTTAVSKAGGAADVAAARSKGLGGALKGLRSTAETISLSVFEKVAPAVETGIRKFTETLPRIVSAVGGAIGSVLSSPITRGVVEALRSAVGVFTEIIPRLFAGTGALIAKALSAPIVEGILTPLRSALAQAKAALLGFFGAEADVKPISVKSARATAVNSKRDRLDAGPTERLAPRLTPTQARARALTAKRDRLDKPAAPFTPALGPDFSERLGASLAAAINNIDTDKLGENLGKMLAKALTAAATASAQITVALGRLLEKVDFPALAVKLGKKAPAILLGLVIGLLNFDFGAVFSVLGDHLFEALLGVLTLAFAPAKLLGPIFKILERIPLVGSLLAFLLRATVKVSKGAVDMAGRILGALGSGFIRGLGKVFPALEAGLNSRLLDLVIRVGVGAGKLVEFFARLPFRLGQGVLSRIGDLGAAFGRLVGAIAKPFANIGSLLFNAGKRLIQGFIDGIGAMFGKVKGTLGDLTGKLAGWKGPPATDAKLLVDNGQLVMGGFIEGLQSRFGDVRNSLRRMTTDMADVGGLRMGGGDFAQRRLGIGAPATVPAFHVDTINVHTTSNRPGDDIAAAMTRRAFVMGY